MKKLFTLLTLLSCLSIYSQQIQLSDTPILSTSFQSNEKPVYISAVNKTVKIVGDFATTTIEYTIYNPNQRTLETNFEFSLSDGQYVSGLALDLNGKWRDGVPVEKVTGQQVYESVIRQNIDPALLEKTVGNNYRVRVYPLLANENRKVRITYDQELGTDQGLQSLSIPVSCTDSLQQYSLTIEVQGDYTPILNQSIKPNFNFRKSGNSYIAILNLSQQSVDRSVNVIISKAIKDEKQDIFVEKCQDSNEYVFYTRIYPDIALPQKPKPQSIDLYWDTSTSAKDRDLNKELNFLNDYISYLQNIDINLYTFNINLNSIQQFQIKNGDWNTLKQCLEQQIYDGASQLGRINITQSKADEILIFSDGVSNFGNNDIQIDKKLKKPIVFISSSPKSNYTYMKYWCNKTKGAFINLLAEDNEQALNTLTNPNIQLISTDYNRSQIKDVTVNEIVGSDGFSITGKLLQSEANLDLKFGVGEKVLFTKGIKIKNNFQNYDGLIEKIWAERKIDELSPLFSDYKDQIAILAEKYNIVTDNMSLIVLDRIEDYVTYRIAPPKELLEQYNELIEEETGNYQSDYDYRMQDINYDFQERVDWWTDKKKKKNDYTPKENIFKRLGNQIFKKKENDEPSYYSSEETIKGTLQYSNGKVTGQLIETSDDWGVVGMTIKNLSNATVSDLDGKFEISAKIGDIIEFSYIGYETQRITVTNGSMEVKISSSQSMLSEMVVVAYAVSTSNTNTSFQAPELSTPANSQTVILEDIIQLKDWEEDAPYMQLLEKSSDTDIYANYLNIKDKYLDMPSFFLDVASLFETRKLHEQSLLILSNLAELELQNYNILRVLAHRLMQLGYTNLAIPIFENVLSLRAEEPQSYRDLALCYEQNKEYQKAIDLFSEAINKEWDSRFEGIEVILVEEMNHSIAVAKRKGKKANLETIDKRLIKDMPLDIRIVLNWDTDNSDMDLYVIDPNGEKCYYGNDITKINGMISEDFTGGYGPEEFLLKKAIKGTYKISANYFGSNEQTLIGPTTIYLDIFTNYGRRNEEKQTIMLRLDKDESGMVDIGEIKW